MDREAHLERLKRDQFDVLVIGGGATGTGVALDAASRGLKVALLERDDFSAGTSSRSTKLLHGGVRYLEQAVKRLDRDQFRLVQDALHERATLIRLAPHLARPMPILTPLYSLLEVPYMTIGLKLYDLLAGRVNLAPSGFIGPGQAARSFPMLRKQGLRGAVIYYDGQFDDARMNVALALTAAQQGAAIVNHVEVKELLKTGGRLVGAVARDPLTGDEFEVRARVVVNAAGPFADAVRRLDDPDAPPMLTASSGVHLVLDGRFSPPETGLLIPRTDDGRVLFILPWLGYTLVGTTDNPAPIEAHPEATDAEAQYLLSHVARYFDLPIRSEDVLAKWSGLRPLVSDPKAADTAKLSRDHVLNASASGLLTITGGKWTTYRKMALDTVDVAVELGQLGGGPSRTQAIPLVGGADYEDAEKRVSAHSGLDSDVARHLLQTYGDQAEQVLESDQSRRRLVEGHPYLEAEVTYSARHESARSAVDFLARRIRLAFVDQAAAAAAVPRTVELLSTALGWDEARSLAAAQQAYAYLRQRQGSDRNRF